MLYTLWVFFVITRINTKKGLEKTLLVAVYFVLLCGCYSIFRLVFLFNLLRHGGYHVYR